MTKHELKEDPNFLSSLILEEYSFEVYLIFVGTHNPHYYAFYKDELLFEGIDFKPSPLYGVDSLEIICSLCSFLTTKIGDVERDYFADYSPKQLAFIETSDCEGIGSLLSDFGNCDADSEANQYRIAAKITLYRNPQPYYP